MSRYPSFPEQPGPRLQADHLTRGKRQQVAQEASRYVGKHKLNVGKTLVTADSSGLVRAAYLQTGVDVFDTRAPEGAPGVVVLYRYAKERGLLHRASLPQPGDVAFFHDTFDRNGDGLFNDPLTHAALVERVDADGTVVLVHRVEQGVIRQRMNLRHPLARKDPQTGKTWNHFLRKAVPGQPARTTAELFAGFGTLILDEAPQTTLAAR